MTADLGLSRTLSAPRFSRLRFMTTSNVIHLDEQHADALEGHFHDHDDFPAGMLASPTRTRL